MRMAGITKPRRTGQRLADANNPEKLFSVELFQESLFGALMMGQFSDKKVRNEFDKICAFLTGTKRIDLLKQYLSWLVSESEITEADQMLVANLLLAQNINLNNY
jgi:hypothetical protein